MKTFPPLSPLASLSSDNDLRWSPRLDLQLRSIGRWPLPLRIAIWTAAFMLGAGLGGIPLLLPAWQEVTAAREENRQLTETWKRQQRTLASLRSTEPQQDEVRTQYATWLDTLPQEADIATLLKALNRAARERGIALRRLTPGPPKSETEHTALPLAAELEGEYTALADFVRSIALLPWPVTMEKLSLAPVPGVPGQLRLQLSLHSRQLRWQTEALP